MAFGERMSIYREIREMREQSVYKKALTLAVPMMIQNGITNAVSLVDNLMGGSLGTESMTAVSIVGQLIFVFFLAVFGGLSGPGIFPVAVRMVWQVANRVKIPVIGMGGIEKWQDAIEMMMAGANAIQIGAAMFYNPKAPIEVIDGMQQWMQDNGVKDINEIVGTVQPW